MKNCSHFQNQIADYVAGRLSPEEREGLLNHNATCSKCADALRQETLLFTLFAEAKVEPTSIDISRQLLSRLPAQKSRFFIPRRWVYGSGLVTATAMAVFSFLMFQTPTPVIVKQSSPEKTSVAKGDVKKEHPYVYMLNEMQDIGVKESQMLISASHSVQQVASSSDTQEGEVQ